MDIKPKFINADGGAELVILTRAEFDSLVDAASEAEEMAEDIAIVAERKARLASGAASLLPPEVSARVLKGESILKAVRNWRDKTQMQLSSETGLGQGYISDIEAGRRVGTSETLRVLAEKLDVPVTWLISE